MRRWHGSRMTAPVGGPNWVAEGVMTLFLTFVLSLAALATAVDHDTRRTIQRDASLECSRAKTAFAASRSDLDPKIIGDSESSKTDVRHYRLDIEVDPDAHTIKGSTTMTVASRVENLSTFRFWLNASMAIRSVEVDGDDVEWRRLDTTTVDVALNRSFDEDEVFDIEVRYRGAPDSTVFFENQGGSPVVSTFSQPWYASSWWAVKEDNRDKATGELVVTVPSDLTVVSNGRLVAVNNMAGGRRRFHWATDYPTSPYLFFFSATVYNTFRDIFNSEGGSMPVDFYVYPDQDTPDNRNGWLLSLDMLATFEELFGPYPFISEKYTIYQFPFSGGMEHQTATGQGGDWAFSNTLTSHELAHQWWGDMVTCATWHDIWLNEGFATYSTGLWNEFASGIPDVEARQAYMESCRPSELDGTVYVYDISDPDRIFSGNYSYYKGAWVLHMLRGAVGDDAFFKILRAYRERFEYSTATTDDFRAVAEEIWGGDLGWFFDEWIYGGGAPAYRYGWQEHEVNGDRFLEIVLEQNQDESVFVMPVEIATLENGQDRSYRVWNDARVEHLLIPVSGEVDDVELDPNSWILSRDNIAGAFFDGPPKIIAIDPAPSSGLRLNQPLSMSVSFHRDVVISSADVELRRSDGVEYELDVSYGSETLTATIESRHELPRGWYRLTISDDVVDAEDGIALDGEIDDAHGTGFLPSGDGLAGGAAVIDFEVVGSRRVGSRVAPRP
jgi:aminopeptidase N